MPHSFYAYDYLSLFEFFFALLKKQKSQCTSKQLESNRMNSVLPSGHLAVTEHHSSVVCVAVAGHALLELLHPRNNSTEATVVSELIFWSCCEHHRFKKANPVGL